LTEGKTKQGPRDNHEIDNYGDASLSFLFVFLKETGKTLRERKGIVAVIKRPTAVIIV
jgi:hypothetical protein